LEHLGFDLTHSIFIFSSSQNVPATTYLNCATAFVSVPLDKFIAFPVWQGTHIYVIAVQQLTFFNSTGSDRKSYCTYTSTTCTSGTYISASYTDWVGTNQFVELVKTGAGNGTGYSANYNFGTQLLGAGSLSGAGSIH
jgi:hypothetical protein